MNLDPKHLRRSVLNMAYGGQTVHVACAFSIIEILSVLYSRFLKYDAVDPESADRDFFVLSKGHGVMAAYAVFREIGWISDDELARYFSDDSTLHGLAEARVPGLEVTTGSLGHGLPVATGIALGLKRDGRLDRKVFCLVGDGEMNEGPMWESMLFAGHHDLTNLCIIVDANQFQAMGATSEILHLEPLADKFKAFGFETLECDGHDCEAIDESIARLLSTSAKPKALIARTLKGHGVSFMAGENSWHYTRLDAETHSRALAELV